MSTSRNKSDRNKSDRNKSEKEKGLRAGHTLGAQFLDGETKPVAVGTEEYRVGYEEGFSRALTNYPLSERIKNRASKFVSQRTSSYLSSGSFAKKGGEAAFIKYMETAIASKLQNEWFLELLGEDVDVFREHAMLCAKASYTRRSAMRVEKEPAVAKAVAKEVVATKTKRQAKQQSTEPVAEKKRKELPRRELRPRLKRVREEVVEEAAEEEVVAAIRKPVSKRRRVEKPAQQSPVPVAVEIEAAQVEPQPEPLPAPQEEQQPLLAHFDDESVAQNDDMEVVAEQPLAPTLMEHHLEYVLRALTPAVSSMLAGHLQPVTVVLLPIPVDASTANRFRLFSQPRAGMLPAPQAQDEVAHGSLPQPGQNS